MPFTPKQVQELKKDVEWRYVRSRQVNGRQLSYIEGWHAMSEANRIFGFDCWNRETLDVKCAVSRETRGSYLTVYTVKVRVTVRANNQMVVREGHGTGEGRGSSPGEAHDFGLKAVETPQSGRWRPSASRSGWGSMAAPRRPDRKPAMTTGRARPQPGSFCRPTTRRQFRGHPAITAGLRM